MSDVIYCHVKAGAYIVKCDFLSNYPNLIMKLTFTKYCEVNLTIYLIASFYLFIYFNIQILLL